ncbi:PLP-dependent aminotransferase family protein [Schumannella soli]|uniref:PLP-dependent aminotransferase family protein n=1 Tax=Schumannella soli TaxID=2590779 RepID=A0A506XXX1_9MICO|nr:PLP-dependent aminotransferase family protein [Schumannella soli]TPW77744.1 PLP-dependent aminotransferase family protein [Schumannella soli]
MDVHISLPPRGARTTAIHRQLASAIVDGVLAPGARLPATRELAAELGVARTTVSAAYDRLLAEGLVEARVGAGTFVADVRAAAAGGATTTDRAEARSIRQGISGSHSPADPCTAAALHPIPLIAELAADDDGLAPDPAPDRIRWDFAGGSPDPTLFPHADWRRLIAHHLRATSPYPGGYGDPTGLLELRVAIARHVRLSRAVAAEPDDVHVTLGAQHGLGLIARALLRPGDTVAVEEPGYPPVRAIFASLGARIEHVPVDAEGLRVDLLPPRARLVYATPSHQFPLGMPMTTPRRLALLAWAERHGAAVVEDDYDSEFRYGTRPLDSLHSLDRAGRVIHLATFSKSLAPGLRLGFLVAPPSLRAALRFLQRTERMSADPVPQAALADLLDTGVFAARARRSRRIYAERHRLLTAELGERMPDALRVIPSHAGLHLTAYLDAAFPRTAPRLAELAAAAGIRVTALDPFYARAPTANGLLLGFGRIPAADIPAGVAALARVTGSAR